jgi:hypothetical protein
MPDHRVRVVGYADAERETEGVSLLRAEAVFRYLVEHGVEAIRIDALAAFNEVPPESQDLRRMLRKVRVEFYNPRFGTPRLGTMSMLRSKIQPTLLKGLYPKGHQHASAQTRDATLSGLRPSRHGDPRVARCSRPRALRRNPVGIRKGFEFWTAPVLALSPTRLAFGRRKAPEDWRSPKPGGGPGRGVEIGGYSCTDPEPGRSGGGLIGKKKPLWPVAGVSRTTGSGGSPLNVFSCGWASHHPNSLSTTHFRRIRFRRLRCRPRDASP